MLSQPKAWVRRFVGTGSGDVCSCTKTRCNANARGVNSAFDPSVGILNTVYSQTSIWNERYLSECICEVKTLKE